MRRNRASLRWNYIEQTNNERTCSANAQIYLKPSLMYHDDERIGPDASGALTKCCACVRYDLYIRKNLTTKIRVRSSFARKVGCVDPDLSV